MAVRADGAIDIGNAYPRTPLLFYHRGSVEAPDFTPFNADPATLPHRVDDRSRIQILALDQPFTLHRLTS